MRYLGNKEKLLPFIEKVIDKYNISGTTFADLFSGTCSVGDYFKDRYAILANDFLYYSYIISCAKLKNNKIPEFRRFRKNYAPRRPEQLTLIPSAPRRRADCITRFIARRKATRLSSC